MSGNRGGLGRNVEVSCSFRFSDSSSSSELDIQKIYGYRSDSTRDSIVLSTGDSGSDKTAVFKETTDIDSDNVSTDKVPTFTKPFAEQEKYEDEE